jgi:hypothetical protein
MDQVRLEAPVQIPKQNFPGAAESCIFIGVDFVECSVRYAGLVFVARMKRYGPFRRNGILAVLKPPPGLRVIRDRERELSVKRPCLMLRISVA